MKSFNELLDQAGAMGRYQKAVLAVVMAVKAFSCIVTISPVFVAVKQDLVCVLNFTGLNGTQQLQLDACNVTNPGVCQSLQFDQTVMETSIGSQYSLSCEREYLITLSTTMFFLGFTFGCPMLGWLSDRFGRLRMLNICLLGTFIASVLSTLCPFVSLYCIVRLLTGFFVGGDIVCGYNLNAELVDKHYRFVWGVCAHIGWSMGSLLFVALAYAIRNHIHLQYSFTFPLLLVLLMNLFVRESPRWLYATGRYEQCQLVLRHMATWNGRDAEAVAGIVLVPEGVEMEVLSGDEGEKNGVPPKVSTPQAGFWDLMRMPALRNCTFVIWFLWFNVSISYYGILFNMKSMGGDFRLNFLISMLLEAVVRPAMLLVTDKFGRKTQLLAALLLSGCTLLLCGVISRLSLVFTSIPSFLIALSASIGRFGVIVGFEMAWLCSSEVFPTVVRNVGVGSGSTWARIAGMLAPQINLLNAIWVSSPMFLLSALSFLATGLIWCYLPETRGRNLPETLQDGETLAQDVNYCGSCTKRQNAE